MTIKQLIEKLSKFDEDLEVVHDYGREVIESVYSDLENGNVVID